MVQTSEKVEPSTISLEDKDSAKLQNWCETCWDYFILLCGCCSFIYVSEDLAEELTTTCNGICR